MRETPHQLLEYFSDSDKLERCGVILKNGIILESVNIHSKPETGFHVDPAILVDNEDDLAACWHTHPGSTANLSQADYDTFLTWPDLVYYIVGVDGIRCFVVEGELVVEEKLD